MRKSSWLKPQLLFLLLSLSFLAHAGTRYSNVFIFGDSLSDTGNIASVIGNIPAPYYKNRISNGPIAVDVLTKKLGFNAKASLYLIGLNAGGNYAVAGAKAGGNTAVDLDAQLLAFQVNNGFIAPVNALYVIFIGGNDVRAALYSADNTAANVIIETAIKKVSKTIKILSRIGARSFFVINAPNIATIPETRLIANATGNPALFKRAENFSKSYNKKLHKLIETFEDKHRINIIEFDLFTLFNSILKTADKFGFSNTTEACFLSSAFSYNPTCHFGASVSQFIFFDEIHPTKRVHAIIGKAFYKALNDDDEKEDK